MNLRQAAQQALETLRWNYKTDLDNIQACEQWVDMLTETVAALENALLTDVTPAQVAHADAVAEPVAWMQEMPVSGNEERSVRMTTVKMVADEWDNPIPLYLAPTPQPEQEPVAWSGYDLDAMVEAFGRVIEAHHSNKHPFHNPVDSDARMALRILRGFVPAMKAYTAPTPQREHITDGSPCWCNPDVIEEAGGNVIVHNYEDNWQQYAKPGETAQQCIERHRGEQDALMKLYATPRRPLTEEEIVRLMVGEDRVQLLYAKPGDPYFSEFAEGAIRELVESGRAIERAHGITGEAK